MQTQLLEQTIAIAMPANDVTPFGLADDRRLGHRVRTVYRVCRIATDREQGLARVRNISDGGMKLSLGMPVMLGDIVRVALTDTTELEGRVVWTNGDGCGLQFDQPIESIAVLRDTAQHCRGGTARAPRLQTEISAVAVSDQGMKPVRICDVSQRGMKLAHNTNFVPGLGVKVMLGSGVERRGVIRWANDRLAGVMLVEPFEVAQLGAVSVL